MRGEDAVPAFPNYPNSTVPNGPIQPGVLAVGAVDDGPNVELSQRHSLASRLLRIWLEFGASGRSYRVQNP
jgi:hypothetical protein